MIKFYIHLGRLLRVQTTVMCQRYEHMVFEYLVFDVEVLKWQFQFMWYDKFLEKAKGEAALRKELARLSTENFRLNMQIQELVAVQGNGQN